MEKYCSHCHQALEPDALFCPKCGNKCQPSCCCAACGQENAPDAHFCKNCGASLPSQSATIPLPSITQTAAAAVSPAPEPNLAEKAALFFKAHPKAKLGIGAVVFVLAALLGSFLYWHFSSESAYTSSYVEASRKIINANDVLASSLAPGNLKSTPRNITQQQLQQQKDELDSFKKKFENKKAPTKYAEEHKYMTDLLKIETTLFQQSILIVTNPLNAETDNLLTEVKNNVEEAKALSAKIQMPNATIAFPSQMSVLPSQLTIFVEEQRKLNREKMERLTAMNEFFKQMDAIILKYNNSKTDLSGMLENCRKGGYTWFDYFASIRQAKNIRSSLRFQVNNLSAPKGAEGVKQQLSDVLTQAINYCDLMNSAANIEYRTSYYNAEPHYKAAKASNDTIQTDYSAFSTNYAAEKIRLTNIDNL